MKRTAVMTMVHNEQEMLEPWIRYYGRMFGHRSLIVIDHSSTDRTAEVARSHGVGLLTLPRETFDDECRASTISNFCRGLLNFYSVVIYTDCDEFLVPDPDHYKDLAEYCERMTNPVAYAIGLNVRHVSPEPPLDLAKPLLPQRKFARLAASMCKPSICQEAPRWNPGFHTCDLWPGMDKDLFLFHMKFADRDRCLARLRFTRDMPWSDISISKARGKHQRQKDEDLIRSFDADDGAIRRGLSEPPDFAGEVNLVNQKVSKDKKGNVIRGITWPSSMIEIPERFKRVL